MTFIGLADTANNNANAKCKKAAHARAFNYTYNNGR